MILLGPTYAIASNETKIVSTFHWWLLASEKLGQGPNFSIYLSLVSSLMVIYAR